MNPEDISGASQTQKDKSCETALVWGPGGQIHRDREQMVGPGLGARDGLAFWGAEFQCIR